MTNPMISPQPNYSGVTIQIANPSVYASDNLRVGTNNNPNISNSCPYYQGYACSPHVTQSQLGTIPNTQGKDFQNLNPNIPYQEQHNMPAYPPQYYLNNYNYQNNGIEGKDEILKAFQNANPNKPQEKNNENFDIHDQINTPLDDTKEIEPKTYDVEPVEEQDLSKSKSVIEDLDARALAEAEKKKNNQQKRVVALTDEYIKSLENYLNNPNDEIRLMASKEILTRFDEDKDRYNDAALNALLNKMLQDPSKLIRVAALSALSSQLASGNDYTVQLLHNIQQNPSADKEDVLQAADILLKMSAGTEIKDIPNPASKEAIKENNQ